MLPAVVKVPVMAEQFFRVEDIACVAVERDVETSASRIQVA